jgi:hypothetical protein
MARSLLIARKSVLPFAAIAPARIGLEISKHEDRQPLTGLELPSMEITMDKYLVALSVTLSVAGFAAPVLAQNSEARDAAMSRCISMAHAQYPQDSVADQAGRTATYKACMNAAGFQP